MRSLVLAIALLAGCSGTVVAILPAPSPTPTDTILVDRHASSFGGQRSFTLTIPRTGPVSYKFEGGKEGRLTPSDKLVAQLPT